MIINDESLTEKWLTFLPFTTFSKHVWIRMNVSRELSSTSAVKSYFYRYAPVVAPTLNPKGVLSRYTFTIKGLIK